MGYDEANMEKHEDFAERISWEKNTQKSLVFFVYNFSLGMKSFQK